MSAPFKSFLKGLLEKNKDKRSLPPALPPQPLFRSNQVPRLDWPALANHPFISDCDDLAPVVYMPGAVEYSQLPRVSRTAAAAAVEEAASKPSAAGSASGKSGTASARMQAAEPVQQKQQQQQQYLRVGSPAEGRADVLHLGGNVSLPLSDMVGCSIRGFGGGYCGFKSLFSLFNALPSGVSVGTGRIVPHGRRRLQHQQAGYQVGVIACCQP
jgi:hypothetical protein